MKLFTDILFEQEILSEAKDDGSKELYIKGIFAQAEKKNRNGRIYPRAVLEEAIRQYNSEYVIHNRSIGELNHPDSPIPNAAEACVLITSLEWQGNDVIGKAKVLDTPKGKIVRALIEGGVQLGVSTRGLGSIRSSNGQMLVENDYSIRAIDVVSTPSGIDCWVNGVNESVNYKIDHDGQVVECEENKKETDIEERHIDIDEVIRDFTSFVRECA